MAIVQKTPKNWRWATEPTAPGRTVIFDIDGVLSNAAERQHYLSGPTCNWKAFFEACGDDTTIAEAVQVLQLLADDVTRVLLTGRPLTVQDQTVGWLERHDLPWDLLIMRDAGEYGDSLTFKRQSVRRLRVMGFDALLALEDDPRNKDMYEEEGVPCMYVHSGYYDLKDEAKKRAN